LKSFRVILFIGIIEIMIGGGTHLGTGWAVLLGSNAKPNNVLFFVITAALTSFSIGVGILRFKKLAYRALLYFASVVLLSKLLIFLGIIHLNGAMETTVPSPIKNGISILYHGFVIYYLRQKDIKKIFHIWP
jgi:xanthine/uracil permease